MPLDRTDINAFLGGIANHARAGNFDQVAIQTRMLVEKMEEAMRAGTAHRGDWEQALPAIREILPDAARSDVRAILDRIGNAQDALGMLRTAS